MGKRDFDFTCEGVIVSPNNGSSISLTLEGVDERDLFDFFDAQEAIDHFGEKDILDQIGEEAVRKHFNISEE